METNNNSFNVAGIVTYNPELERFESNINAICPQCDKVIVFDNGSNNFEDICNAIKDFDNVKLIDGKENKGIGYALNRIVEQAKRFGAKWVLLLDQDSIAPPHMIDSFKRYTSKDNVAIVAARIADDNRMDNESGEGLEEIEKIGIAITSGSYLNINIWESIGKFREDFFIDAVDSEYCIRAFFDGYLILMANRVVLRHELGKAQKTFFLYVSNHNAMRRYHIARNNTYVASLYQKKLYSNYDKKQRKEVAEFLDKLVLKRTNSIRQFKFIILVLLYEKDKFNKIKAIITGMRDGRRMAAKEV